MRQGHNRVAVDACHGLCTDHGVDDGFFRCFNGGFEERTDAFVGNGFHIVRSRFVIGMRVGRGEGDEDITGAVAGDGAGAGKAEGCAACEAFELMRQERRIRGNDDDDGTDVSFQIASGRFGAARFA